MTLNKLIYDLNKKMADFEELRRQNKIWWLEAWKFNMCLQCEHIYDEDIGEEDICVMPDGEHVLRCANCRYR